MEASGSSLFDKNGLLISINTFKTFGKIAYFYAMPADWIEHLKSLPIEPISPFAKNAFWKEELNRPFFLQAAMSVASRRGDQMEMHRIAVALAEIDSEIAEDFNKAIGCPTGC